ncbi:Plant intracellular Ras-group-related LRR protein 7 [Vitis vinifera]|uniref:Plant intracellular Ras-group-related LRR protein 7 n=1 Tax=Vitis vinifera TaxID=29760 RepID=A0A438HFZ6_VITVI|nr:Plant intracellular Ras-group-related LRR protein 7 [Vitis vinifera]
MGCCLSKNGDSKASRIGRWKSTGIVALRDSKLKANLYLLLGCLMEAFHGNSKYTHKRISFNILRTCFFVEQAFPDEVLDLDTSVRTLDLTHNRLVDIPMEISKLINMQRLILADNLIERLPMNLGKLQSLKVMTLDGNQVTTLPDELGMLVRLERLSISGNLLTCLPETIGSLRNLLLLNVSNNKLKCLPESVGSCFSLEELQANASIAWSRTLRRCLRFKHVKFLEIAI